jgi:hypothetical protein
MGLVEDLSASFVAFTIEVDDAAESRRGRRKGPWLVSLAMSENWLAGARDAGHILGLQ